jgi:hypothetical protein
MSEPEPDLKEEIRHLFRALAKVARTDGGVLATPEVRAAIAAKDAWPLYDHRREMPDGARRVVEAILDCEARALDAQYRHRTAELSKRATTLHDLRPGRRGPYRIEFNRAADGGLIEIRHPGFSISDVLPRKARRGASHVLCRVTDASWIGRLPTLTLGPRPTSRVLGVTEGEVRAARKLLAEADAIRQMHSDIFDKVVSGELRGPPGEPSSAEIMIRASPSAAFGAMEQDRLPRLYPEPHFSKRNAPAYRFVYLVWMIRRFLDRMVDQKEISQTVADAVLALMTDRYRP